MVSAIVVIECEPIATKAVLSQKLTGDSKQADSGWRFVPVGSKQEEPRRRTQAEVAGQVEQGRRRSKASEGRIKQAGTLQ